MTDEEILRKKLDRLNKNSTYGLPKEDKKMSDIKPLVVVFDDRHNGKYSGGKWTAWNMCYVPSKIFADEKECADFFAKENLIFGRGETPQEAIEDLKHMRYYGSHMTRERIKAISESTEDEEDNEMKATSTEKFHDIIAIDFELQTFPSTGEQDKFIVTARNRDDIFAFEFNGPCLVEVCRKAGLLTGWEKDQKIKRKNREINELNRKLYIALLLETNKKLKEELSMLKLNTPKVDMEKLVKENKELKDKLNLEKAANEAQHKFFRQYAGKGTEIEFNYAIGDTGEVTYVIVDKEKYNYFKDNSNCCTMINGRSYTPSEMVDRIVELEELKAPTIDNFVDEEPSTRRDILKAAEKCVCGQREQDYGTPESNFQLIADLWNGYLFPSLKENKAVISATDVAMMMALLKIARIKNGGGSGDSFVDLAGYAACGGEIWAGQKHQKDLN